MSRREFGVAFSIPEPFTTQLQGWRERLGDPNACDIPPHVTLLPPTALHERDLADVEEHLRGIAERESAFDMHLRGTGTFRPVSPVVFVAVADGIASCERIQEQIRSGPLARRLTFPYHPHVTVAHDLPEPALEQAYTALASYDARFRVWGFTLFEQGPDGVWRPQRDFTFGAGGRPGPLEPPSRPVFGQDPRG